MRGCLYKISKPIEPLRLKEDGMDEKYRKYNQYTNPNPNAWEFIRNFESYKLIPQHDISYFRDRLIATRMTEAYEDFGFEDQDRNFFVPTNGAFLMKKHYTELIDRLIVQNHIVDYGYLFQREVDVDCTAIPESNPVMLRYKQNDTLTWSRNLSSSYSHPLTVTPISMNILLTVFVSNGIVNIIDGVIGIDLKNATHKQLGLEVSIIMNSVNRELMKYSLKCIFSAHNLYLHTPLMIGLMLTYLYQYCEYLNIFNETMYGDDRDLMVMYN
uniref:FAS1 domain-containing protein n=1 Tax=Glossina palpalis gambiensis TaxID=67801 RepID=A0A1B0C192_9MUSC